jgi:hypothetical protein
MLPTKSYSALVGKLVLPTSALSKSRQRTLDVTQSYSVGSGTLNVRASMEVNIAITKTKCGVKHPVGELLEWV